MLLSLNWLKDFVKIPSNLTADELGLRLTCHTVEVESVREEAEKFNKIVIGKIIKIKKHQSADRLQLVEVDIGPSKSSKQTKLEIVCGASNISVGQFVPVALVGAILPNGIEIKQVVVRGEKSDGMLCAADELGLGDDHSGIMILEKAKIGQNLADYLKLSDVIFEVDNKSITHRPDLWSHYGMAREIAAFLGVKLKKYEVNTRNLLTSITDKEIKVGVEDFALCPRYMAIVIEGIKIATSPKWMQERLTAVGMRSINNIVDITNYVMMEIGQPLHAFDRNLVDQIIVRRAKKGEKIKTLDGQNRELDNNMLVIADSRKPVAIAGVMGGGVSEISDQTKTIIIESANFDFVSIRKTSQKLGLRTESSIRYEKALDPNLCELGIAKAVELIKKFCPKAKVSSQLSDTYQEGSKFKLTREPISLDLKWLNKIIGQEIDERRVKEILTTLGFSYKDIDFSGSKTLSIEVPSWRATRDINIKEDLVEEIVRIYDFNNLKLAMPMVEIKTPLVNQEKLLERKIKNILAFGAALDETYNYSFVAQADIEKIGLDPSSALKIANPLSDNQTMLRQSLAIKLFDNIKTNQARFNEFALFEIGNIFINSPGEINKDKEGKETLPYQEKHLAIVFVGDHKSDVFLKAKSIINYLLNSLNFKVIFNKTEVKISWADSKAIAGIYIRNKIIGTVAKLSKKTARQLNVKKDVALAEISLKQLFSLIKVQAEKKYHGLERYPSVMRDLAFLVNEKVLYNDIKDEIINFDPIIKQVDLFDVYQAGKFGPGRKNLAFHIIYQTDKTLTSLEVDKVEWGLVKRLKEKFGAQVRDF